jgi:hypothetical protein
MLVQGENLMRQTAIFTGNCAPEGRSMLKVRSFVVVFLLALGVTSLSYAAENEILGEVQLRPAGKVEKSAGIWVDGQYLGFLKELKGNRKILLMPGRHDIKARLSGHHDFDTQVEVVAGDMTTVRVAMRDNLDAVYPDTDEMAKVKILVNPSRAAVFVNDSYVGHVEEFRGFRKSLGLAPGTYKIHITLPGYQPFESEMTLLKEQKYEIKTTLRKGDTADENLLTYNESVEAAATVADTR